MLVFIGKEEILNFLDSGIKKYEVNPSSSYIAKEYKHALFYIKIYKTGSIVIEGKKEKDLYNKFIEILNENNFIGMDEVGVGDFFGPTVYTAVKMTIATKEKFKDLCLSIKDSKKIKDEEIIKIYNTIKNIVEYEVTIVWDKDIPNNFNSIEQKMYYHYKNYEKIRFEEEEKIVIDLFTTVNNFNKVSQRLKTNYPNKLILENQADSKFFCVALASIISRYYFIKEMEKLNQKYNFTFPYGANVKNKAKEFVKLYSKEELSKFCKTTFKTFDEL